MRITVTADDITGLVVDAVVNAANPGLAGGGGVDGAIHRVAGPKLARWGRDWVDEHGPLAPGASVVCDGFGLPARWIIQTVGPVWAEHPADEARDLLASSYRSSLEAAIGVGATTVAFPNISTGIYGFPKELAIDVVAGIVDEGWDLDEVVFACFDPENRALYEDRFGSG